MDFRLGFGGVLRRGDRDRRRRRRRARARAPARGGGRAVRRALGDACGALREGATASGDTGAWVGAPARRRGREARRRARASSTTTARRCIRCGSTASWPRCSTATRSSSATAATSSPTPAAWSTPTSRAAGWTPGPFGCLGSRPGLRAGGQARPSRPPGRAAARRRRVRLLGHGVRHARAPRRQRRRRDGQQRDLGAREAPDGVPLRLLGRGRAAARARATTRSSRRSAATASSCARPDELRARAGARVRGRRAGARQRAHGPGRRLPAQVEPGLRLRRPDDPRPNEEAARVRRAASRSGPVRTGRGTCLEGPFEWSGRREAPIDAASPEPMCRVGRRAVRHDRPRPTRASIHLASGCAAIEHPSIADSE